MSPKTQNKILIFIPTYNAEKTLQEVLLAIPQNLLNFNYEILILDDCSQDKTFKKAQTYKEEQEHLNINIGIWRKSENWIALRYNKPF